MLPESPPTPHLYEGDNLIFFKDIKARLLPLRGPVLLENAQLLELAKVFCYPGTWHLSFSLPGLLFFSFFTKLAYCLPRVHDVNVF